MAAKVGYESEASVCFCLFSSGIEDNGAFVLDKDTVQRSKLNGLIGKARYMKQWKEEGFKK